MTLWLNYYECPRCNYTWEEAEELAQDQEWEYVSEDTSFEAEATGYEEV